MAQASKAGEREPNQAASTLRSGDVAPFTPVQGGTLIPLSRSVQAVRGRLLSRPTSAWDLARELGAQHPDYAGGRAGRLKELVGPADAPLRTIDEWLDLIGEQYDPDRLHLLEVRAALFALPRLEPRLATILDASFLETVEGEALDEAKAGATDPSAVVLPLGQALRQAPAAAPDVADSTPFRTDAPSGVDLLGRRALARALAAQLAHVLQETEGPARSFMVHLYGAWGSGKTSLLRFLQEEMEKADPRVLTVSFNAWQHQHLDPPWWFLLNAIHAGACRDERFVRRWWLRVAELVRRAAIGRASELLRWAVAVLAAAGLVWLLGRYLPSDTSIKDAADTGSKVLALASALLGIGAVLSRSLLPGSGKAARAFIDSQPDPMGQFKRHFEALVRRVDRRLVVLIDDVDRCQARYVVSLLEGMQTLFADTRSVFVVAADRDWLNACFARVYADFADVAVERGRRPGALFLEKAFQLAVPVPHLAPDTQRAFFERLLRWSSLPKEEIASAQERLREEVRARLKLDTESEIYAMLADTEGDDLEVRRAKQEVAIEQLATPRAERSAELFLLPFVPLLEENPRAMKRLLPAFSVRRANAILYDANLSDENRRKLALWTIACMRWPVLEDYYTRVAVRGPFAPPDEVSLLRQDAAVNAVLHGTGIGVELDLDAIRMFVAPGAPVAPAK